MRRAALIPAALGAALTALFLGASPAVAHPGIFHDLERVTAAIDRDPGNAELLVERAYYFRLNQQFVESLADLDRARALAPADLHVRVERGLTLSALSRDAEAEADLTAVIDAGAANEIAYAERARIRERAGRRTQAVADYKAALARKPDVELYLACGALQEASNDPRGAAATYEDAGARLGPAVTIHLALIRVDTALGRYDAALKLIDEEMSHAGARTDWYLRRADVLESAGRKTQARATREQALAEANRVIETNPNGIHLYARARVHASLGNIQDAVSDLELTLNKSPRFAEAGELLARLRAAHEGTQRTRP